MVEMSCYFKTDSFNMEHLDMSINVSIMRTNYGFWVVYWVWQVLSLVQLYDFYSFQYSQKKNKIIIIIIIIIGKGKGALL